MSTLTGTYSIALNLARAEALELQQDVQGVHALYEGLLRALGDELEELEARRARASPPLAFAESDIASLSGWESGVQRGTLVLSETAHSKEEEAPSQAYASELRDRRQTYSGVYITYIRFARRTGGVEEERTAFAKACKDKWSTWEVFEAAGAHSRERARACWMTETACSIRGVPCDEPAGRCEHDSRAGVQQIRRRG